MAITTTIQIAKDRGFEQLVYNETVSNTTTKDISLDISTIPYGTTLHSRLKYTNGDIASNWSRSVSFTALSTKNVIGVCLNVPSSGAGTFSWIDAAGNSVSYFDFTEHPTFQSIAMVTEDAARAPVTMTQFPLFYIKTATSGPVGTFSNGKKCWWISDTPIDGFRPHPAFKRATNNTVVPFVKIGTFVGHSESASGSTVIGSKRNTAPYLTAGFSNFLTYCNNRNNSGAGQSGWRMFDVHDWSLLRFLALIAKGSADVRRVWGNTTGPVSRTGSSYARLVFKGTQSSPTVWVDDLWGCWWNFVHGCEVISDQFHVCYPSNQSSYLGQTCALSRSKGFIRNVASGSITIGPDTHDFLEYFVPNDFTSSESNGTFYAWSENDNDGKSKPLMTSGANHNDCGPWNGSTGNNGVSIFNFNWESNNVDATNSACRICKN